MISKTYPLHANPTKWSNTLKQLVGKLPTNCLSVFDHSVGLALKGLRLIFNRPLKQWLTGKKEGKTEMQKCEYLENKNNFLDRIKSIFHNYLRAIIWWKMKNSGHKLKKFRNIHRKTPVMETLLNKVADLKACKFIKKWLQHRCFPKNTAKFLRTAFSTEHLQWLLL